MDYTKLNNDNFAKQVVEYGWFPEQLPPCFASSDLAKNLNAILSLLKYTRKSDAVTYAPTILSSFKDDTTRRILSLPNAEGFLRLIKLMADNWDKIKEKADSENSLSPITYLHKYDFGKTENINDATLRDILKSKSDFLEGIYSCIRLSLGYKYRLSADIVNCYDTIYTHSVTWAILGKNNAKQYYKTKSPISDKDDYEFADRLDKFTRLLKNNETNGIIVGSFTSRIFSELVLSGIDKELRKNNYVFRRYVDDYKFYFRTESQASDSIGNIQKILNTYNLNLNSQKIKIEKFPYETVSRIPEKYKRTLKESGVFGVLNAASIYAAQGEKGAYKYALKFIKSQKIPKEDASLILPMVINIMLIDPKYGKYVTEYLFKNKSSFDVDNLSEIINFELGKSIELERHQEAVWFLYIIQQLKLKIFAQKIIDILRYENDFMTIIALDLWKNKNKKVVRTRSEATAINTEIKRLAKELVAESYVGNHWLLLYEIDYLKLIDRKIFSPVVKNDFFIELYNRNIHFYKLAK